MVSNIGIYTTVDSIINSTAVDSVEILTDIDNNILAVVRKDYFTVENLEVYKLKDNDYWVSGFTLVKDTDGEIKSIKSSSQYSEMKSYSGTVVVLVLDDTLNYFHMVECGDYYVEAKTTAYDLYKIKVNSV